VFAEEFPFTESGIADFFIREEREDFDFGKRKSAGQPSAHRCPYALPRSHTPPSAACELRILRALRGQIQKKFGELKAKELLFDI